MVRWWTAKELRIVREMAAEKAKNREIAERLGKTVSQVKAFCYHKGIRYPPRRRQRPTAEKLQALVDQGHTAREISRILGNTYPSIKHCLQTYGIRIPPTTRSRRSRETYQECVKEWGLNLAEVSHLRKKVSKVKSESMTGLPTEKRRDQKRK